MLDPSKLNPQVLAELTNLVKELPHDKIMRMQSLMHNMMAGIDTQKEMIEFENSLPPGFRERMAKLMYQAHGVIPADSGSTIKLDKDGTNPPLDIPQDISEARLTILRAVAAQTMTPQEALHILFPND